MCGAWLCKEPLNFPTSSLPSNHLRQLEFSSGHFSDYYKLLLSTCFSDFKALEVFPFIFERRQTSLLSKLASTQSDGDGHLFLLSIALSSDLPKIWDVIFVIWTSRSQQIQLNNSDETSHRDLGYGIYSII